MLTGKCKEDFEKWYLKEYADRTDVPIEMGVFAHLELNHFYKNVSFSMQYGVYVDFFDSVGIVVTSDYSDIYLSYYSDANIKGSEVYNAHQHKTRHEARTKAIEKANEIYNNQNQIK